jgi:hypothetical protein
MHADSGTMDRPGDGSLFCWNHEYRFFPRRAEEAVEKGTSPSFENASISGVQAHFNTHLRKSSISEGVAVFSLSICLVRWDLLYAPKDPGGRWFQEFEAVP